jgi:ABC-2 type transport system permease protein
MTGAVFRETIRRGWRLMLGWGIGLGAIFWLQIIIVPDVAAIQQMANLMTSLPPIVMQMFGGGIDVAYMATPEGYLSLRTFNSFILIFFAAYAVTVGMNVTANDEDAGIQDVVMSLPVSRARFVLEKLLAYALMTVGVVLMATAGTLLGVAMTPSLALDAGRVMMGMLNFFPATLLTLMFTAMIGALIRRRSTAMAIAVAFVVGSYFLDTIGAAAAETVAGALRAVSYFTYFDGSQMLQHGLNLGNILVLLVASVVFGAISLWAYERRDIGV